MATPREKRMVSAMGDSGSDAVTVTCQASLPELRAATFWLYTHDRQARIRILLYLVLIVGIFILIDNAAHHWDAVYNQRWSYWQLRGVASFALLVGVVYRGVTQLWTMPARAWRRISLQGPDTLTVSSTGLSRYNSKGQRTTGWDQYDGYVVLPEALLFLSRVPYIVPRSTVSPIDFERVLAIAKRDLQPVKWYDSRTKTASYNAE